MFNLWHSKWSSEACYEQFLSSESGVCWDVTRCGHIPPQKKIQGKNVFLKKVAIFPDLDKLTKNLDLIFLLLLRNLDLKYYYWSLPVHIFLIKYPKPVYWSFSLKTPNVPHFQLHTTQKHLCGSIDSLCFLRSAVIYLPCICIPYLKDIFDTYIFLY